MKKYKYNFLAVAVLSVFNVQAADIDVNTLPSGEKVRTPSAATVSRDGNKMVVQQSQPLVQIDWDSFNIGRNASVQFQQPSNKSVAYNRVVGNEISQIQGKLVANGRVILSNQNGILFTKDAKVDVGSILATTAVGQNPIYYVDDKSNIFPLDKYSNPTFERGQVDQAVVENQGTITAQDDILFLAQVVKNNGTLKVVKGQSITPRINSYTSGLEGVDLTHRGVRLETADRFELKLKDEQFSVQNITAPQMQSLLENGGMIISQDQVFLTNKGKQQLKDYAVNNNGVIEANSVRIEGNTIVLGNESDIAFGVAQQTGANLEIVQTGMDKPIQIGGHIRSQIDAVQAKSKVQKIIDRLQPGDFVDEDGKVRLLLTIPSSDPWGPPTKQLILTTPHGDQYIADNGDIYTKSTNGTYYISAPSVTTRTRDTGFGGNATQESIVELSGTEKIMQISYRQENGKIVAQPAVVLDNPQSHDPINQLLIQKIQEKLNTGDLTVLDRKVVAQLYQSLVTEQIAQLKVKTHITAEQLKQVESDRNVQTLKTIADTLGASEQDLQLLSSLVNTTNKTAREASFSGVSRTTITDPQGRQVEALQLNPAEAKNEQQKFQYQPPTITVTTPAGVVLDHAQIQATNSPTDLLLLTTATANTPMVAIGVTQSDIDLHGGGLGIGHHQDSVSSITTTQQQFDPVTKLPKLVLQQYGQERAKGSFTDLLDQVVVNSDIADLKMFGKDGVEYTFADLFKEIKQHPEYIASVPMQGRRFNEVLRDVFSKMVEQGYQLLDESRYNTIVTDSYYNSYMTFQFNPSEKVFKSYSSVKLGTESISDTIQNLQATPNIPFTVDLDHVNLHQVGELVISGGFQKVNWDHVAIGQADQREATNIYIQGAATRDYQTRATNLSDPVTNTGYEYGVYNLKERLSRAYNGTPADRWTGSDNTRYAREFGGYLEGWLSSQTQARHHTDDSIQIKNSNIYTQNNFTHLFAKNITLENSTINTVFNQDLSHDVDMQAISKIGINGDQVVLDNTHIRYVGADRIGVTPPAGLFFVGNMLGKHKSSIYGSTHQYATMRVDGDSSLKGETGPQDLDITLINTGKKAQADGFGAGTDNDDAYLNNVAFHAGDAVHTDEHNENIGGTRTVLENMNLHAYAPNGAPAYASHDKAGAIEVGNQAHFDYYEDGRVTKLVSTKLSDNGGTISVANRRQMLRQLDAINGVPVTTLSSVQVANTLPAHTVTQSLTFTQSIEPEKVTQLSLCDDSGKCEEKTLGNKGMNASVNVGELE